MNFKKLWVLLFVVFQCTSAIFAGKVVFLRGSACAGKTSLCAELIKQDPSWKYVDGESIFFQAIVDYCAIEFPAEFPAIRQAINSENIIHALKSNKFLFKSDASSQQRLEAKNAIAAIQELFNARDTQEEINWKKTLYDLRNYITEMIIDYARQYHVIVDTWILHSEHIKRITQSHSVIDVIVYCSFPEIVHRTMKRNYIALMNGKDISSFRFSHQGLITFIKKYDLSDNPEGAIATVDKTAVIHALDLVEMQLQNSLEATGTSKKFTRGEFSLQEFQEYRKNLLKKFTSQTAYVISKYPFDMVIMTDDYHPAECAQQIISYVHQQK